MSSNQNDASAKENAIRALRLNKVNPEATPSRKIITNKKIQPTQKTHG